MLISLYRLDIKIENGSEFSIQNLELLKKYFCQGMRPEILPAPPGTMQNSVAASSRSMASEKQLELLKSLLQKNKLAEDDFCRKHNVSRLEELSMKNCHQIIHDLKEGQKNFF